MENPKVITVEEYKALSIKGKMKTKYMNKRCDYKGITFDSHWERDYYQLLMHRKSLGVIKDVKVHIDFPIRVKGIEICKMNIDFVITNNNGTRSFHDAKQPKTITPVFKLKAKLFKAIYGEEIEIKMRGKW